MSDTEPVDDFAHAHARDALVGVRELRSHLRELLGWERSGHLSIPGENEGAASERLSYLTQQDRIRATLLDFYPLYRFSRVLKGRLTVRAFYSGSGELFTAVGTDDYDLVSWAHPIFAELRRHPVGARVMLAGRVPYTIVAETTVERETSDGALEELRVTVEGQSPILLERVWWENDALPTVAARVLDTTSGEVTPAAREDLGVAAALVAEVQEIFAAGDDLLDEGPFETSTPRKSAFALPSRVATQGGRQVEIPFALDAAQNRALIPETQAVEGSLLVLGPPGAGKTTIALLRATIFKHSLVRYDTRGRLDAGEQIPEPSIRVFVVTEHLTGYLREFLTSRESALPEARVVCLRGSFLEEFLRDDFLARWLKLPSREATGATDAARGSQGSPRPRLLELSWFDPANDPTSDMGVAVKSAPFVLALCYRVALDQANSYIERRWPRDRELAIAAALKAATFESMKALVGERAFSEICDRHSTGHERVAKMQEEIARLDRTAQLERRIAGHRHALAQLSDEITLFLEQWVTELRNACRRAEDDPTAVPLGPGEDQLLLGSFVSRLSPSGSSHLDRNFAQSVWQKLRGALDPRTILLDVVKHLEQGGTIEGLPWSLLGIGDVLKTWRSRLETRDRPFVRSDFPLLAAVARTFYAAPVLDRSRRAFAEGTFGFELPASSLRYDHVIVDEGQDFSYAELLLVMSFAHPGRNAVTVSGDPRQRMHWRSGLTSLENLRIDPERRFTVARNYRQTRELGEWVRRLFGGLFPQEDLVSEAHDGPGPAPWVINGAEEIEAAVTRAAGWLGDWYRQNRHAYVAALVIGFEDEHVETIERVLNRSLENSMVLAERIPDGRLIQSGRVAVATVPTVKGLEFDGVLVLVSAKAVRLLERTDPDGVVVRNQLYVACTRAKHWLGVVAERHCEFIQLAEG